MFEKNARLGRPCPPPNLGHFGGNLIADLAIMFHFLVSQPPFAQNSFFHASNPC